MLVGFGVIVRVGVGTVAVGVFVAVDVTVGVGLGTAARMVKLSVFCPQPGALDCQMVTLKMPG